MRIAIIDDELHCINSLELHLNKLYPISEIVFKSTNPREAIDSLLEIPIDLLFLDIEMPGINGFELLEQFNELPFNVIFVTAYSQYAIRAFKAQAINYLLKPVDEDELKEAVDSWQEKRRQKENSPDIDRLLQHLKKEGHLVSKIAIPVSEGLEFLDVKDILYCQSKNNYTYIHMVNGDEILISKTLKTVEQTLERFFFLRTHQSYLINPNFMKRYIRSDGGYLIMSDDKRIPVSNSKKDMIVGVLETMKAGNTIE